MGGGGGAWAWGGRGGARGGGVGGEGERKGCICSPASSTCYLLDYIFLRKTNPVFANINCVVYNLTIFNVVVTMVTGQGEVHLMPANKRNGSSSNS